VPEEDNGEREEAIGKMGRLPTSLGRPFRTRGGRIWASVREMKRGVAQAQPLETSKGKRPKGLPGTKGRDTELQRQKRAGGGAQFVSIF